MTDEVEGLTMIRPTKSNVCWPRVFIIALLFVAYMCQRFPRPVKELRMVGITKFYLDHEKASQIESASFRGLVFVFNASRSTWRNCSFDFSDGYEVGGHALLNVIATNHQSYSKRTNAVSYWESYFKVIEDDPDMIKIKR